MTRLKENSRKWENFPDSEISSGTSLRSGIKLTRSPASTMIEIRISIMAVILLI